MKTVKWHDQKKMFKLDYLVLMSGIIKVFQNLFEICYTWHLNLCILSSFFASPETSLLCLSSVQLLNVTPPWPYCPLEHLTPFSNVDIVGVVEATVKVNNANDVIIAKSVIDLEFIEPT